MADTRPDILDVINDPSVSKWLLRAIRESMNRDPVDAANDAAFLSRFLDRRLHDIQGEVKP